MQRAAGIRWPITVLTWRRTGDVITAEALDFISQASKPLERRLEFIRMEHGEDAAAAELEKGDDQVMAMIYRGSDDAMADGMKTIGQGVEMFEKSIGAQPDSIRDMINDSGMLADLKTHQMVLGLARSMVQSQEA